MTRQKNQSRLPKAKGIDMATEYSPKYCEKKAKHLVLQDTNRRIVDEFITILGMKEKFVQHEVPIPNKLVMFGPPGTGKTLTAFHIASLLQLPLILVRLDAIIHSHLGETASNVRKVFDFAKSNPCVLFLDEFDAIARTRENNDEVKEMARVVNTLLQCLDEFNCDSIFVAATNLEEELDSAVWRRFDTRMTFAMPTRQDRRTYMGLLIGEFPSEELLIDKAETLLAGCSFADLEQIVLKAKRKAIIVDRSLTLEDVRAAFHEYNPKLLSVVS